MQRALAAPAGRGREREESLPIRLTVCSLAAPEPFQLPPRVGLLEPLYFFSFLADMKGASSLTGAFGVGLKE